MYRARYRAIPAAVIGLILMLRGGGFTTATAQTINAGTAQPPSRAASSAAASESEGAASAPAARGAARQSGDQATTLQDVVVTANKRAQVAREVPSAVSVVGGAQLERINAANLQDIAGYIPGLNLLSSGTGENQIVLRGITTGPQSGATVGVYLDEVPMGASSAFGLGSNAPDLNLYDLSRVEVLSGPQGTLYGATTLGGLVKYVTNAPEPGLYGSVQGDASKTTNGGNNYTARGTLNFSVTDNLNARVNVFKLRNAGVIDTPNRGRSDVDRADSEGVRASVSTKFGGSGALRLSALSQTIDRAGKTMGDFVVATSEPVRGPYEGTLLVDEPFRQKTQVYSGLATWDFGSMLLTSVTAWQKLDTSVLYDITPAYGSAAIFRTGTAFPFRSTVLAETKKFSQEVRLASAPNKSIEWQVGGFYADESSTVIAAADNAAHPTGLFFGSQIFYGVIPTKFREGSLFGSTSIYLNEKFDVTLGARYSRNRQQYTQRFQGLFGNPSNPAVATNDSAASSESVSTFLVNPRYRVNPDLMIYARAASGYRPGGPNFVTRNAAGVLNGSPTFKADTLWNYELGTKAGFLDGRGTVDFSVYRIDWKDIQLVSNTGGLNQIENGGTARVQGAELSANFRATRGLTVGGSLSLSDAKLTADSPALNARSGQRLPLSPRIGGALTLDYRTRVNENWSGSAGLSVRYVGERNAGFDGSFVRPQYRLPAYQTVDLRFGLHGPVFDVSLYAKNVLNKAGQISAYMLGAQYNPAAPARITVTQPRTVGVVLTANF